MVAMVTMLGYIQALNYVFSIAPQQWRSSKSLSCNSSRHYWSNLKSQQQRLELMKLGKLELGKRGIRYESQWQCAISDDGENKETNNSEEEITSPCCNQVGQWETDSYAFFFFFFETKQKLLFSKLSLVRFRKSSTPDLHFHIENVGSFVSHSWSHPSAQQSHCQDVLHIKGH